MRMMIVMMIYWPVSSMMSSSLYFCLVFSRLFHFNHWCFHFIVVFFSTGYFTFFFQQVLCLFPTQFLIFFKYWRVAKLPFVPSNASVCAARLIFKELMTVSLPQPLTHCTSTHSFIASHAPSLMCAFIHANVVFFFLFFFKICMSDAFAVVDFNQIYILIEYVWSAL